MRTELILDSVKTPLIPGAVEYSVLLPPGYDQTDASLPLLLNMHGGSLDRNSLAEEATRKMYEYLWEQGTLPPMVVACYSARMSWHLNYYDKSEMWEDFAFEFMALMQSQYNTHKSRAFNYLIGISMGAMGALRLTLKYPDRFGAVAAMAGVINPVLNYDDLQPRNYGVQHNLPPEEQAKRWGWPVDRDYYRANNHANIAQDNAEAIRAQSPKIYLECGDHDYFNSHDGAEFLHRVLWENRIEHEYRLLHDCDHVGASWNWRVVDAHRWLARIAHRLAKDTIMPNKTDGQQNSIKTEPRKMATTFPSSEGGVAPFNETLIRSHRRALPNAIKRYADDPLGGVYRNKEK